MHKPCLPSAWCRFASHVHPLSTLPASQAASAFAASLPLAAFAASLLSPSLSPVFCVYAFPLSARLAFGFRPQAPSPQEWEAFPKGGGGGKSTSGEKTLRKSVSPKTRVPYAKKQADIELGGMTVSLCQALVSTMWRLL